MDSGKTVSSEDAMWCVVSNEQQALECCHIFSCIEISEKIFRCLTVTT